MGSMTHHEVFTLFMALGVLLGVARLLGEIAIRFHQPAVMGELLAGILLGPSIMGTLAPGLFDSLFPTTGAFPIALETLTTLGIVLFLLVAGMEVDLSSIWRQGRSALLVGMAGLAFPFATGFTAALVFPGWLHLPVGSDPYIFALFIATALSISALPVIAKILMDLNLYRSDMGMIVIAAAIFNDLIGWIIFAFILGLIGSSSAPFSIFATMTLLVAFTLFTLTLGRRLLDYCLPWIHAHTSWPGGILGVALTGALFSAAFTEWIGVHAIFGAFLFGVAIGDSRHLRIHTRSTLDQFISFIFAPIFFASIGLKVNFIANFDLNLVMLVLVIATIGKVFGSALGAKLVGISNRESWAIGFGLNARGAMEIILGLMALRVGLIGESLFVALVIMALVTSMMSGTCIELALKRKKPRSLAQFIPPKAFVHVTAQERREVIQELCAVLSQNTSLNAADVADAVWNREEMAPTGLSNGIAIPHARLVGLGAPLVAVGISAHGIDFDATDGESATLIFLILTPVEDATAQTDILADIAVNFGDPALVQKSQQCKNFTEFKAIMRSDSAIQT